MCRQSLFGTSYGLLNVTDFDHIEPQSDFYVGLLWKHLMGVHALKTSSSSSNIRAYAHCHAARNGSVVVAYINLNKEATAVDFSVKTAGADTPADPLTARGGLLYSLQAKTLVSQAVELNGRTLAFDADNNAPDLSGRPVASTALPGESFGFVQLSDDVTVPSCKA